MLLSLPDDSKNQSSSHITTLLNNFRIAVSHNELEGNDEQPKIIETIHKQLKTLEKQIHVNEATLKFTLPVFQSPIHSAKIMEQI